MKRIHFQNRGISLLIGALIIVGISASASNAAITPISLGRVSNFAVLSGGGISNSGLSSIQGDLGLTSPISYSDTGLLTLKGSYHFGDSEAVFGQADASSAYVVAAGETPSVSVAPELAGVTLSPGVYSSANGFSINGTLTLNAQNNPNALFVFQTSAGIATGAGSHINLINGAQACNVFWQIGTTTSLSSTSDFKGNILGKGNFVSAVGSVVQGRVLISQGSIVLNSTQIVRPQCLIYKYEDDGYLVHSAGSYQSTYGNASYNVKVLGKSNDNGTYAVSSGTFSWSIPQSWKFTGKVTSYAFANGSGTINGTGQLLYYGVAPKGKEGRWINIASTTEKFTIKFTRVINPNGTIGNITAMSVGFTGDAIPGAPLLPALGVLSPVKGD